MLSAAMNYQQTIDYLYQQLPMFSKIGDAAYKKDLYNTFELCTFLNNPQKKFKSIHVAGTNGKGSTSNMLAAILQTAGYKTGLYTSPHLKDFRERIKVDGKPVAKKFVTQFVKRTKNLSETIQPSFFELTVAMAFEYFASQKVDIAIIETGLGGRLDSTNIINPILSVITNIGFDHMNILGNTLEEIAFEKAGIIKPNTPVVIGEYIPKTKPIFINKAKECNSKIYFAQDEYTVTKNISSNIFLDVEVKCIDKNKTENFSLDLNGLYQAKNICTVLCAKNILTQQGFLINSNAEKFALSNTKKITGLHGRWDVIAQNPTVVLDVAHNEDGIKQVLNQLLPSTLKTNTEANLHFVIGFVKDKDVQKILSLLPQHATYYFTNAHTPRALPAIILQKNAAAFNLFGNCFDNVNDAIYDAKQKAKNTDIIIVCGSVYVVGEVDFNNKII